MTTPPRRIHPDKDVSEGMVENLCNFFTYQAISTIDDPDPSWAMWKEAIGQIAKMISVFQSPSRVMEMVAVLIATCDFDTIMEEFYEEMRKEAKNN